MTRRWSQLSSRKRRAITQLVYEAKGDRCYRCGAPATTVDHIVPDSLGGPHTVANLEPCCRSHNSSRQDTATGDGRFGARTIVVTGPPASGKSAYVEANASPADVVIDLDRIAAALTVAPSDSHDHPPYVRHVAIGARAEAIHRATRLREPVTVWLIHAVPSREQLAEYRRRRFTIVAVDPGEQLVQERIAAERPAGAAAVAARWYEQHDDRELTGSRRW